MFFTGIFEHVILHWVDREIYSLPEGVDFQGVSKGKGLAPAIYSFPAIPRDNSALEQQRFADAWKTGSTGLIVVAPPGASPMFGTTMFLELATNVITAVRRWLWLEWAFENHGNHRPFAKLSPNTQQLVLYAPGTSCLKV